MTFAKWIDLQTDRLVRMGLMLAQEHRRAVLVFLQIVMLSVGVSSHAGDKLKQPFAVGQMWSLKSSDKTSPNIVIGRIEPWNDKVVVHISVINVLVPEGSAWRGYQDAN